MKSDLTFSGGPELERALRELGGRIAGRLGENATRAGARIVQREAKAKVPVRTGRLRDSIVVRGDRDLARLGGRERQAFVVARTPYAHIVEFGSIHTTARSFLRNALDTRGQAAIDQLGRNLGRGIEREARKLGQRNR